MGNILILPGDGIGQEVMEEVKRVITWFNQNSDLKLETSKDLVGGTAYDAHGTPITESAMEKAMLADAVLFGAVGGPAWDNLPFDKKPERALLRLRKDLGLFANLRPAICFDALKESSSLKPELVSGLDILIVRELTGGVYFGEPRGIETLPNGERRGINTQVYDTHEIHRVARVAFELAKKRSGRVASAEKHNVMESGILWKEEVTNIRESEYQDVELSHILADNCGMQLVKAPKQFDIILTDNLFGDLLSDVAAMLTGSLGMLPSASLGEKNADGKMKALYEPVHGSAPDIQGQGKANPLACILSLAMAYRYSFDRGDLAEKLENAVGNALASGARTGDIAQKGDKVISTTEMGNAVISALEKSS